MAGAGQIAEDAKSPSDASFFYHAAVNAYPGSGDVASAQFNLAWDAHEARNYSESSRLLTEHLASYADKNTDNRGRAGYWAARDSERGIGHEARKQLVADKTGDRGPIAATRSSQIWFVTAS
jgi:hypothetical protein